jgi:uncharacterized membrane protein
MPRSAKARINFWEPLRDFRVKSLGKEGKTAMDDAVPRSRARSISIAHHPIYAILLPVPIVCFIGALLTDITYQGSGGNLIWVNFSSWLIAAGLLFGAFAGIVLLIDAIRLRGGWLPFGLLVAAWIVELVNSFVHARDGWTAVFPLGLILSAVAVLLILTSGWLWQSLRYAGAELRP